MINDSNGPPQQGDGLNDDQMRNSSENVLDQKKNGKKDKQEQSTNIKMHSIYTTCRYAKPNPTQFRGKELLPIIIQLVVICVWGLFEWFRLNNGYSGNINETFPEFVSFILLTFANLILTIVYIFIGSALIKMYFSIELICVILELIFIFFELIVCFSSISSIVKAQLLNRKYKRNKQKNIELEPVGYFDDEDEINEDTDEKKPFGYSSNQQNYQGGGYRGGQDQQSYYNSQYDNYNNSNNYQNRNINYESRDVQRRDVQDENSIPQQGGYNYQNYNNPQPRFNN